MNSIPKGLVMEAQFLEKRKPKLDERFIKQVDGKDFVLYSGLLDLAHQKNLISMDVELIQYPGKDNDHTAVCRAIARTTTGGPFIDVGDANPNNCNSKVAKHLIRMASTRAKARCLRDLTNIGMTALEELADLSEVINGEIDHNAASMKKNNVRPFPARQAKTNTVQGNQVEAVAPSPRATQENAPGFANSTDENAQEAVQASNINQAPVTEKPAAPEKPGKTRQAAKSGNGNGNGNGNGKTKADKIPLMSEAQKNAIYNLSRRRNISVEELEELARKTFNMNLESLSSADASQFIRTLQQAS